MSVDSLYPRNDTPELDMALFRRPTAEYRGTRLWSWNTRLERTVLLRQIGQLREMGFGGFHIHSRTGLATDYLGDAFMGHVRVCAEQAAAEGMLCWLYDEDRWPSGFAGGLVTRDERFRAKHLLVTVTPYNGTVDPPPLISNAVASRNENGVLLARYHVVLRDGYLASYRQLAEDDEAPAEGRVWYAYLETAVPLPWWNNQTYVDTLDFLPWTTDLFATYRAGPTGRISPTTCRRSSGSCPMGGVLATLLIRAGPRMSKVAKTAVPVYCTTRSGSIWRTASSSTRLLKGPRGTRASFKPPP